MKVDVINTIYVFDVCRAKLYPVKVDRIIIKMGDMRLGRSIEYRDNKYNLICRESELDSHIQNINLCLFFSSKKEWKKYCCEQLQELLLENDEFLRSVMED